ncbi:hypothetical protein [Paenibacillus validus]|uniref:O-antigen ligase domain-containing protein n=1 Tax=Paenibacillus validus TaxID=44253 RepID=A0A7X2ZAN4_9BACL|nr:hypothetical protein [Paenibacillus validus]MUG70820.1 hypothetical protein [Paenibacillus validus]
MKRYTLFRVYHTSEVKILLSLLVSWIIAAFIGYVVGSRLGGTMLELSIVAVIVIPSLLLALVDSKWLLPYNLAIWVFTPEIRRLYDWSTNEYHSMSLISLTPIVVSMFLVYPLMQLFKSLDTSIKKFLILWGCALGYALVIGLFRNGSSSLYDLANIVGPLLWLAYIFARKPTDDLKHFWILQFVNLALVVALYGIIQYTILPPWDVFWMDGVDMASIGKSEPFEVRVFSTLNSPGPAGVFLSLAAAIMIVDARWRKLWGWMGVLLAVIGSIITLVRAAWMFGFVTILIYIIISNHGNRFKKLFVLLLFFSLVYFILLVLPQGQILLQRFETFGEIQGDESFNDRLSLTKQLLPMLFSNIEGMGLGSMGMATRLQNSGNLSAETGIFDSGIGTIMLTFGVIGTPIILYALCHLAKTLWLEKAQQKTNLEFNRLSISVMLASIVNLLFANSYTSAFGVMIWFIVALGVGNYGYRERDVSKGDLS